MTKRKDPKDLKKKGRKRVIEPISDEDLKKLGEELVAWVKVEDKENPRLLMGEFYILKKKFVRKDWEGIVQRPDFRGYYEYAQQVLAKRCIDGTMEKGFGHRYLRLYDRELIKAENEQMEWENELKKMSADETKDLLVKVINYATQKND